MGRSESEVWQHFNAVVDPETKYKKGKCKYCSKPYVSNAARMAEHLAQDCPECSDEIREHFSEIGANGKESTDSDGKIRAKTNTAQSKGSLERFLDTKISKESHDKMTASFARAVYASSAPLSMFENPYWQDFFKECRPSFKVPSRYQLSNSLLNKESDKIKTSILQKIRSADCVTLMSDGWTNINGDSIINILFATPTPVFYSSIDPQGDSHTGVYIGHVLGTAIHEVGAEKVKAVVSDNAANMKSAWRILIDRFPHLLTYGCLAHGLNLMLNDICKIPMIEKLLTTDVKDLIHFFKMHEKPRIILKKIANYSGNKFSGLRTPVPTRWQSQRASLHSVLRLKYALKMAVAHEEVEKVIPSAVRRNVEDRENYFWPVVEKIYNLIAPVSLLIKNIEGDRPNLSYFTVKLRRLFKFLKKKENLYFLDSDDEDFFKNILVDRQVFMHHPVQVAAHLLNPRLQAKRLKNREEQEAFTFINTC